MRKNILIYLAFILMSGILVSGCSGISTFNDYARAGDTVALAVGWKTNFTKKNITVTITPSIGSQIVIPPNDSAIRAAVNLYPDPVSSAVVSREINKNQSPNALLYGALINGITGDDKDWYQTTIMLDLPVTLPAGTTFIEIENSQGDRATSTVEIIEGTGAAHAFTADSATQVNNFMFLSMSRTKNYAVVFDGSTVPYAVEVTLSHDADEDNGGIGKAFAINPIGFKKNLLWSDDGYILKAILMPASNNTVIDDMHDYKFYVAGQLENMVVNNVSAYDINGNEVSGVTATITEYD